MFKKIILSVVATATLSTTAFGDATNIWGIRNQYDLSIACTVTKEVFKNYGGGSVSFKKNVMYGGIGESISVNSETYCLRLGNYLLANDDRKQKMHSFIKQRMDWEKDTINDLTALTLGFLLNPNIRASNLIDFAEAILENKFEKADKIITENRQILYLDGRAYEKDRYGSEETFPKLLKKGEY